MFIFTRTVVIGCIWEQGIETETDEEGFAYIFVGIVVFHFNLVGCFVTVSAH